MSNTNLSEQIETLDMIQSLILKGMKELIADNVSEGAKDLHLAYRGLDLFLQASEEAL